VGSLDGKKQKKSMMSITQAMAGKHGFRFGVDG
jgi:hypothetical protein